MARLFMGFISSKVFVMLNVAICIMLATAAPLVQICRVDRGTCERGGWIYYEVTDIVSYTLLLRNISELSALLVQVGKSIIVACFEL